MATLCICFPKLPKPIKSQDQVTLNYVNWITFAQISSIPNVFGNINQLLYETVYRKFQCQRSDDFVILWIDKQNLYSDCSVNNAITYNPFGFTVTKWLCVTKQVLNVNIQYENTWIWQIAYLS